MALGFIGFGEAAFELAKGLKGEGFGTIVAYDPMLTHAAYGSLVKERGEQAQVELLPTPEEVLKRVEIVAVAVPSDRALEACRTLKPHVREGMLYVDLSASSPSVKKQIGEHLADAGADVVDAAMLGALTVYRHKVPMLLSGSGSERFAQRLGPYGTNMEIISANPGDASAIKLIRSIFMKGIAGLFIEVLEAAHALQVEDKVIQSLKETMENGSFEKQMNQLVTGTSIHALRRSKEVEGSIEMLESLGIDAQMAKATRDKLIAVSELNLKEKFQGKRPDGWVDVISMIASCKEETMK